jgi:hypothetical protein
LSPRIEIRLMKIRMPVATVALIMSGSVVMIVMPCSTTGVSAVSAYP